MKFSLCSHLVLSAILFYCSAVLSHAHEGSISHQIEDLRVRANQGDAKAQYSLGYEYSLGRKIPKDEKKALKWFHQAAELGNPGAQFVLVNKYNNGIGVKKNKIEAYKWALLAAANGSGVAKDLMPQFKKNLSPKEEAKGQRLAAKWQLKLKKKTK